MADFDNIGGIADILIGELADVDEAILVNPEVHEGTKSRHVGDDPGQLHSNMQVRWLVDAFGKLNRFELFAGIAAGPGQLIHDVPQRRNPYIIPYVVLELDPVAKLFGGEEVFEFASHVPGHFLDHGVPFRVHRAGIEGILGVANPKKSGGLFKSLGTEARHFLELGTRGEGAVFIAVGDNVFGNRLVEAGHV